MTTRQHRPKHRPAMIAFVVLGSITCLLLGWWQLSRWNSTSGTPLNLGYALQWPFFAAFLYFVYFRFVRLEADKQATDDPEAVSTDDDELDDEAPQRRAAPQREIPADILPTRRPTAAEQEPADDAIRAYNDYLQKLNDKSRPGTEQSAPSPDTGER